jgi:hypothetical protein
MVQVWVIYSHCDYRPNRPEQIYLDSLPNPGDIIGIPYDKDGVYFYILNRIIYAARRLPNETRGITLVLNERH